MAAHFAEIIVKAHHYEILRCQRKDNSLFGLCKIRDLKDNDSEILERCEYSSPFLDEGFHQISESNLLQLLKSKVLIARSGITLQTKDLLECLQLLAHSLTDYLLFRSNAQDPSAYCLATILWHLIELADDYRRELRNLTVSEFWQGYPRKTFQSLIERIVAKSVCALLSVLPLCGTSEVVKAWPKTFRYLLQRYTGQP